jgi:hypothetical protein
MTKHDEAVEALKAITAFADRTALYAHEATCSTIYETPEEVKTARAAIAFLSTARGEEHGEFQRLYNDLQTAHNGLPADGDYHIQGARRIIRAWMVEVQAWACTQLDHPTAPGEHAALIAEHEYRYEPEHGINAATLLVWGQSAKRLADALEGKPGGDGIDYEALADEVERKYPKILARLAEGPPINPTDGEEVVQYSNSDRAADSPDNTQPPVKAAGGEGWKLIIAKVIDPGAFTGDTALHPSLLSRQAGALVLAARILTALEAQQQKGV